MMKTEKPTRKTPVFIYGLVIGLLVGVLVSIGFVLGMFFNSKNPDDSEKEIVKVYESKNHKKLIINSSKNVDSQSQYDSDSIYSSQTYSYENDSLNPDQSSDNQQIRVVQEQLLYIRYIQPSGNKSNFYCQSKDLDSLLIENSPINKDGKFKVEFWASPVNFVGYKLSYNKLVLFGFMEFDDVQLEYNTSGGLRMRYLNNDYRLQCTDDFVALYLKKQSKN